MHIICLTPVEPGVYNDHKASHIMCPPEGWAMIPEDFVLPVTFPRLGSVEAREIEYKSVVEVDGKSVETVRTILTVISMTEGSVPEVKVVEPSRLDVIEAQIMYTALVTDSLLEV